MKSFKIAITKPGEGQPVWEDTITAEANVMLHMGFYLGRFFMNGKSVKIEVPFTITVEPSAESPTNLQTKLNQAMLANPDKKACRVSTEFFKGLIEELDYLETFGFLRLPKVSRLFFNGCCVLETPGIAGEEFQFFDIKELSVAAPPVEPPAPGKRSI